MLIDGHIHCVPPKVNKNGEELLNPIERIKIGFIGAKEAVLLVFSEDTYKTIYAAKETAIKAHDYIFDITRNNDYF